MGTDELKALMEKASPRPWSARIGGEYADDVWVASDSQRPWEDHMALKLWSRTMGRGDYDIGSPEHKAAIANAQLLCAAVNTLPALIECAEALERLRRFALLNLNDFPGEEEEAAIAQANAALSNLTASTGDAS